MNAARRLTRGLAATLVSAAALALMARASAARLAYHDSASARLRLSWNARPERIEVCRTLSPEELSRREEHMRQRVECVGRFATYTLRVDVGGRTLHESIVRGAGLRHDRPLYLLREFDIAPGVHRIRISFVRRERAAGDTVALAQTPVAAADTGIFAGRAERERVERSRRARAAIPARLVLDTTLAFEAGRVSIVTFDADRKAFDVLTRAKPSQQP